MKTLQEKILDADHRCQYWLGTANMYLEEGNKKKAEECESKCQFWLDRLNKLENKHG